MERYCCELKCFELPKTEVDGRACKICMYFCYCVCKCITFQKTNNQEQK